MKNLRKFSILALFISLLFTSCDPGNGDKNKDKDTAEDLRSGCD